MRFRDSSLNLDADSGELSLAIVSAWYGTHEESKRWSTDLGVDVTKIVSELVDSQSNQLSLNKDSKIGFYNKLFKTDPCPLRRKVVAVRYRYGTAKVRECMAHESRSLFVTEQADLCSNFQETEEEEESGRMFIIRTVAGGQNQGRRYSFKATTMEEQAGWVRSMNQQIQQCRTAKEKEQTFSLWQRAQTAARLMHDTDLFQQFFGGIICTSFIISLVRSEMVPAAGSYNDGVFEIIDLIFTGFFTVELAITFVAFAFVLFFKDAWRVFDLLIVSVSWVSASGAELPAVNSIRAVRVLRAVRLLKKSKSLRPIVEALFSSIVPVLNSMVLLALITGIYASMAVGLFGEKEPVFFGSLSRALFSMFQVCTGDAWASGITRIMFYDEGIVQPLEVLFFVSYMLVASLVLINIIIAVLLDEFLTTMAKSRAAFEHEEVVDSNPSLEAHILDPLLAVLTKYRSQTDLLESISLIYGRLDLDGSGSISYSEMADGLPKLIPNVYFSVEDWEDLTDNIIKRRHNASDGKTQRLEGDNSLTALDFRDMMLTELKGYQLRESNKALMGGDSPYESMLLLLKWIMISLEDNSATTCSQPQGANHAHGRLLRNKSLSPFAKMDHGFKLNMPSETGEGGSADEEEVVREEDLLNSLAQGGSGDGAAVRGERGEGGGEGPKNQDWVETNERSETGGGSGAACSRNAEAEQLEVSKPVESSGCCCVRAFCSFRKGGMTNVIARARALARARSNTRAHKHAHEMIDVICSNMCTFTLATESTPVINAPTTVHNRNSIRTHYY